MKRAVVFVLLLVGGCVLAHAQERVTLNGCVTHSAMRNVLLQSLTGNSYVLEATGITDIDDFLGQQVEVTGIESPTFSTSATPAMSGGGTPSMTITVETVKTISKQCTLQELTVKD